MPLAYQPSPPERYSYYTNRGYVDIGRPAPVDPDDLPAAMRNSLNADPATFVPGAVPNFGEHVAPHIATYAGMWATAANVYDITDEATRNSPENAERMRLTLAIEGCLDSRRKAVARMPWHIEAEDPKDSKQLEIAGILTALVRKTPMFTNLCEWLGLRVWFGRAGAMFALDERHVNRQPFVGMSKRVPWYPVHGDKILMRYDDGKKKYEGGQLGIRIAGGGAGIPEDRRETSQFGMAFFLRGYEREHFIFARHNIEDGPFFQPRLASKIMGVGVRDKIYQTWLTMVQLEQDALTWISRSALGVRLWRYPMSDAKAKAAIEAALKKSMSGGAADFLVPVPPGEYAGEYGVELIEPGTGGVEVVRGLIQDYYMDMITKFILGQTVTRDTNPEGIGGGSWLPKLMTYYDILTSDADVQGEALTDDYIAVLVKKNWPEYQNCWFRFCIDTGDPQAESKIQAAEKLYQMNVPLVTEELYKLAGLTKPNPGDNVVRLQDNQAAMQPPAGPGQADAPGGEPAPSDGKDELAPAQRQDGPAVDEAGETPVGEPGSVQDFAADAGPAKTLTVDAKSLAALIGGQDQLPGGAADGMPDSAFPPEALAKGQAAEAEHTNNPAIAKEIAKDQMVSDGPDVYDDEPSPVAEQIRAALAPLVDHSPDVGKMVRDALTPLMPVEQQIAAALADAGLVDREQYAARWITIGGDAFDGAKHVGGTHVEVDDDGTIITGPEALTGKKVGDLGKSSEKVSSGAGQRPKSSLESLDTGGTSPHDKPKERKMDEWKQQLAKRYAVLFPSLTEQRIGEIVGTIAERGDDTSTAALQTAQAEHLDAVRPKVESPALTAASDKQREFAEQVRRQQVGPFLREWDRLEVLIGTISADVQFLGHQPSNRLDAYRARQAGIVEKLNRLSKITDAKWWLDNKHVDLENTSDDIFEMVVGKAVKPKTEAQSHPLVDKYPGRITSVKSGKIRVKTSYGESVVSKLKSLGATWSKDLSRWELPESKADELESILKGGAASPPSPPPAAEPKPEPEKPATPEPAAETAKPVERKMESKRLSTRHDRRSGFPGYRVGQMVSDKAGGQFVVTEVHKPEFISDGQFEGMKHAVTVRPATADEVSAHDAAMNREAMARPVHEDAKPVVDDGYRDPLTIAHDEWKQTRANLVAHTGKTEKFDHAGIDYAVLKANEQQVRAITKMPVDVLARVNDEIIGNGKGMLDRVNKFLASIKEGGAA